jgi:hypothetical protein
VIDMKTTVKLWVPALIFIAAAIAIPMLSIMAHLQDDAAFATAYGCVLAMSAPLAAFFAARAVTIELSAKAFRGKWMIFVTTAACTCIVVIINVVANLTRLFTYTVEPWEIYGFYLVISISEEAYFRIFLVLGTIMMLSVKNKAVGFTGTAVVAGLAFAGALSASVEVKIVLILLSVAAFAMVAIPFKKNEKGSSPVSSVVAVVISAIGFSLAHFNVYVAYPEMLVATLLAGGVMAVFLAITRNPFVPITAHFCNNLLALRGIIIN